MLCAARRGAVDPILRRNLGPLLAAAVIAAVLSVLLPSRGLPTPHLALKTVICVAIYACLLSLPDRRIPALDLLARNAFAIFFVHGYLVGFGRLLFDWSSAPVHGTIPLLVVTVVLVLAASVAIAELTRSALGRRSRLVLGC